MIREILKKWISFIKKSTSFPGFLSIFLILCYTIIEK